MLLGLVFGSGTGGLASPPRPAEGNKSYAIAASGAASGVSAESAASTVSVAAINIAISGASMQ